MPIGLKWLLWFLGFTNGTRWESLLKMIVMWGIAMIIIWWYLARTVDDEAVNGSLDRVGTKKMIQFLLVLMIVVPLILGTGTNFSQLIYVFDSDKDLSSDKVMLEGTWPVAAVITASLYGIWAYAWQLVVKSLQRSKLALHARIDHYLNFNRVLNVGETCLIIGSMVLISLGYMILQLITPKTIKWLLLVEMGLFFGAFIWMILRAVRLLREFRLKWIKATIGPEKRVEAYYHVPTNAESFAVMDANRWMWVIPFVAILPLLGWFLWWLLAS